MQLNVFLALVKEKLRCLYTLYPKKEDTKFMDVPLSNFNRFSKLTLGLLDSLVNL